MKVTISVIKADVGSVGGHTRPLKDMLADAKQSLEAETRNGLFLDGLATYTGDDIALIMSHIHGEGAPVIHNFAWNVFKSLTWIAKESGSYGAGQDILIDAPSGNLRGAGPAVAEIEFELLPSHRPAEAFLVFAADKCGPGAYNRPLYDVFCDPRTNTGWLLSDDIRRGFTFEIIDMDYKGKKGDRIIRISTDEPNHPNVKILALLRDIDRYAVESIYSNAYPQEKAVSVSATRLHNIAGTYTGKDDPVAIVRTQKIFPATEEVVDPYLDTPIVTGDCRGSHNRTLMPKAIFSPVAGGKCQPIVSCLAFSMNKDGHFSKDYEDIFADSAWDEARKKALRGSQILRRQGPFGVGFASHRELAYNKNLMNLEEDLSPRFKHRKNPS